MSLTIPVIASICIGCYFLGWCSSLAFYVFRRSVWSAIS